MNPSKDVVKSQMKLGNNKPGVELVQVLLKTFDLLRFAYFFIDLISRKGSETLYKSNFQLLCYLTYLSAWLGNVTMLFLGFINKYRTQFLIPKMLSLAHSSSYVVAASTLKLILRFQSLFY